jgi:hypothetical protein
MSSATCDYAIYSVCFVLFITLSESNDYKYENVLPSNIVLHSNRFHQLEVSFNVFSILFSNIDWSSKIACYSSFSPLYNSMSTITYIFALLAIIVIADAEFICPGFVFIRSQQPCVDECSIDNDKCGLGKKCCYTPETPCGYRCLIDKDNVAKPGKCPSPQTDQNNSKWYLCDGHDCDVDNDCRCKKKCCPNKCGSTLCVSPK